MIRILHLRSSSGAGGGPEKTIFKTGALIDRRRFSYHVIYLHRKEVPGSPLSKSGDFPYLEIPERSLVSIAQLVRISRYIREHDIGILHSHDPKTDFYAFILKRLHPGIHSISTVHGWIVNRLRSRLYFTLDLLLLRSFSRVVAVSRETMQTARERGIRNCVLIRNAIDTDEWRRHPSPAAEAPHASAGVFTVGFCGRLSTEKGPFNYLAIAERLLQGGQPFRFIVAGQGPLMAPLKERAALSAQPSSFIFTGHLRGEEMLDFYRKIDILLSPSRTEGLPNSILEAMAMEVPVVATRVGGVEDLIPDPSKGLLAERGDLDTLCRHVSRLRDDPSLRRKIAEEARRHVERAFSFAARVRKIEELYEDVAG